MNNTNLNLFFVFLFVLNICSAQKDNAIKAFDIETFNKKIIGTEYKFIDTDSSIVVQKERQLEYKETIQPKNSHFQIINRYYKSGSLKLTVNYFPNNFLAGIKKEYNEQGKLIKETDYDAPYKFTWEDVLEFIKEHKIDMNGNNFEVGRNIVEERPVWGITYNKQGTDMLCVIGIYGDTGEVFQESEIEAPIEEEYETLPDMENE